MANPSGGGGGGIGGWGGGSDGGMSPSAFNSDPLAAAPGDLRFEIGEGQTKILKSVTVNYIPNTRPFYGAGGMNAANFLYYTQAFIGRILILKGNARQPLTQPYEWNTPPSLENIKFDGGVNGALSAHFAFPGGLVFSPNEVMTIIACSPEYPNAAKFFISLSYNLEFSGESRGGTGVPVQAINRGPASSSMRGG